MSCGIWSHLPLVQGRLRLGLGGAGPDAYAPGPAKEELAEHVEAWHDKMRRLEAHGEEFKLAPAFKINALCMHVAGKVKEYLEIWETDRDTTDIAKSNEELLSKVEAYARRRKLDSSAKEKLQH